MELIDCGGLSRVRPLRWYGSRCLASRRIGLRNHLAIRTRNQNGWILYWHPGPRRRLCHDRAGIAEGLAPAKARPFGRRRRTDRLAFLQLRRAIGDDLVTFLI